MGDSGMVRPLSAVGYRLSAIGYRQQKPYDRACGAMEPPSLIVPPLKRGDNKRGGEKPHAAGVSMNLFHNPSTQPAASAAPLPFYFLPCQNSQINNSKQTENTRIVKMIKIKVKNNLALY